MNKKYKSSITFIVSLLIFLLLTSFFNDTKNPKQTNIIAAKHHHHRNRHHRDGIQFRFKIGPPRRYYHDPYFKYIPLYCEISNEGNTKVTEVQIGSKIVYPNRDENSYHFSLRPGYYKIRWKVKNDKLFGSKYRNYSKTIRVNRNLNQIYVKIKGSNISVRYIGF